MTDREKLHKLLDESFLEQYNTRFFLTAKHTANFLISHGVTVQEMQKPLSLEELSYETDMYWVENEDGCFPVLLCDKSYCFSSFSQFGTEQDAVLNNDDYGKTWRCWAEKPTEGERKAAEWLI